MLISIITPCLNRAEFVSEAIESVLNQNYPHFEHIIVDGGSTDGTLEILEKFPHMKVVSEPDLGMYDAINKGLRLATGDIIGFLNTDDFYEKGIFSTVVEEFKCDHKLDAILGCATLFDQDESGLYFKQRIFPSYHQEKLLYNLTFGVPIFNAWFFRRKIFDLTGLFDIKYKIAGDREFLIRLALRGLNFKCVKKNFYHYRQHSDSLTLKVEHTDIGSLRYEDLLIAEEFISSSNINSKNKNFIRRWHSYITTNLVLHSLINLNLANALSYTRLGLRYSLAWPLIFTIGISNSTLNSIKRTIKSFFKK
jgi:glycosyltransferase involved in cell wall biosynthesis